MSPHESPDTGSSNGTLRRPLLEDPSALHTTVTDSDSLYLDSDENEDISHDATSARFTSNVADHARALAATLSDALDLVDLDKLLAIQAKLSGRLNNQNQELVDRRVQLNLRIEALRNQCTHHFKPRPGHSSSRVEALAKDISDLESRVKMLAHGKQSQLVLSMFGGSSKSEVTNIAGRYPIEFNQARDKVRERQLELDP